MSLPMIPRLSVLCAGLLALLSGCGGNSHDEYLPGASQAREAVEAALAEWKSGKPHETVRTLDTPIDMFDARWRDGQKLESFEITEELPANPHPSFKVRMRFAGSLQDEESTYLVMGIDPLLVFRSEDYERATGM
jgi:hypothetical protein